jgi:hypothetical protein
MNIGITRMRRIVVLATPLVFAMLTLAHPAEDPWELGGALDRWMVVHTLQLALTVPLAWTMWSLVEGITSRSAAVVRAMLPVFLVAFSAFDAVAGLATGWLAMRANDQTGAARADTLNAIEYLFSDNWLAGNLSVLGGVTAVSWMIIAVSGALALRGAGADRPTVVAMSAAALFASHPAPFGTVGLLALGVVVWRRRPCGLPTTNEPVTASPMADLSRHGLAVPAESRPHAVTDERKIR